MAASPHAKMSRDERSLMATSILGQLEPCISHCIRKLSSTSIKSALQPTLTNVPMSSWPVDMSPDDNSHATQHAIVKPHFCGVRDTTPSCRASSLETACAFNPSIHSYVPRLMRPFLRLTFRLKQQQQHITCPSSAPTPTLFNLSLNCTLLSFY